MDNTGCTVIVNTCDAYEDVWEMFFCAFNEHWPECKYNIVLNTEKKLYHSSDPNIGTHNFHSPGKKDAWGLRLRKSLQQINTPYVIMLFDDFILNGAANQVKVEECLDNLKRNANISVFYFTNIYGENCDNREFSGFDLVASNADYRLNSAPAIWRRNHLLDYTGQYDNPWAWEVFGSYRTYATKHLFYCAKKDDEDIYPYNYSLGGAIYRGKWVPSVVIPLVEKYGLEIDLEHRGLADESDRVSSKRSFLWKVNFIFLGFKMIKFRVFLFVFRVLKNKLSKLMLS
jgi:hypothetical protein